MNNLNTSYLLWLACFFGFAGLHRFYNKKFFSGFLWLFTYGFFGVGQFIDLFLIPDMVDEHNMKVIHRLGLSQNGVPLSYNSHPTVQYSPPKPIETSFTTPVTISHEQLMIQLAKAASVRGGKLSVTQAVIDTGVSFDRVQSTLNEMVKKGYVDVDNHPNTGVVIYNFLEI
ncbi:MAG: TM2 domain-containing protein [Gomphosphaeria aponina SAG 52.96 = DSM 107014]|uniref:TM2 domain-containing protein n=1 Tax=Gomphosphaeria aponina SAG 52.96 = DSM 107014 TaxID=1521640 RepID=A0A941GV24_9CHRO|nr:TM2 domain-containing protein [Gomphosphaeria aponina SAG 52.96 = DSM 107014]